jgi:cytochrome c-type biogenesis protein CcmH/NrfG
MIHVSMRSESIAFGVAGVFFGLIAGWVIGTQQAGLRPAMPAAQTAAAPAAATSSAPAATPLDENKAQTLRSQAEREPANPQPRVQLGNMYFDAEKYDEAIKWYAEALKLTPNDVNLSTDLGVSYYYTNQPDKALQQFEHSLSLDPKHAKTLLNVGVVKAFGKQDLEGAAQAWQQVLDLAPNSPEGQAAKRALDGMRSAHPAGGSAPAQKPGA